MARRTNQGEPKGTRGGGRRKTTGDAEFDRLFREMERPLQPEFVVHAYARLAGSIMRRSWQGQPDED